MDKLIAVEEDAEELKVDLQSNQKICMNKLDEEMILISKRLILKKMKRRFCSVLFNFDIIFNYS